MGKRRNGSRAIRPTSYTGTSGGTFTAEQVSAMLAAQRQELAASRPARVTPVAKSFGSSVPPAIEAAEERAGMTPSSPFGPGEPIGPYDGFSRTPRATPFTTGVNIATRPRTHERVSFETLRGLIESYDVAQICIHHRIDSIRSLDWKLIAAEHYKGDVTDAIPLGMKALARPDRVNRFENWLAKWLFDVLAYDAGTLYRLRNRAGRCIGLMPVDGTSVAPLLDYWGNPPGAMEQGAIPDADLPPAFVQYVNGLPWNWLTKADLIYEPFRPRTNSPYGHAPLESILLNANTDLRFQVFFLQRFTEGNVPHAFASAPETWTPDQIEQFQEYWDGFMYGDQSRKHQIRWIPGGSSFAWSDEKDFTDAFSLFLMRKTASAYHVVPADLGFTENVNRSSGESQADVQHRVGDLPLIAYVEGIVSGWLQDDLGLPLRFEFDKGEEQADRLQQAQADKIYVELGSVSTSDIRAMRYGLEEPGGVPVPRFIFTERAGPIPLASLYAVAGTVDPETAAPEPGAPLPREVFGGTEGVLPNPPIKVMSLAEREFGESAMPPAPPPQPKLVPDATGGLVVAKEGEASPSAGITSETGIYSYDLAGREDDEDEDEAAEVAKELAAFRRYSRARRRAGEWRDFRFEHHGRIAAHRLNDAGRSVIRKAAGELVAAGLAVVAADTGRVLMLQRGLDPSDPASGTWEMPGGHVEDGEEPYAAAAREWQEETGCLLPHGGGPGGSWLGSNGVYQGFTYVVPSEESVPIFERGQVTNPDDPDSDQVEAIAWWAPGLLPGNPAIRAELAADIDAVMSALAVVSSPADDRPDEDAVAAAVEKRRAELAQIDRLMRTPPSPGGTPRARHRTGRDDHLEMGVAKAGDGKGPKGWPGWNLDLRTAAHWAPKVTAAAQESLTPAALHGIATAYIADHPDQDGTATGKRDRNDAAKAWLIASGWQVPMGSVAGGITADAAMIGGTSAQAAVNGEDDADTGDWEPGDTGTARQVAAGLGVAAVLALLPGGDDGGGGSGDGGMAGVAAGDMEDGYLSVTARVLAGWDAGVAADELASMLEDVVTDGGYAEALTVSQITTVSGLAAGEYYLATTNSSLQWVAVIDSRTCPSCLQNAAAGPRRYGDAWPAGAVSPPQHPGGCRCALVPADL